ncbi:hypothetical protein [Salinibacter sp.]|uniref:hypothetical protein n=1 Tax=Salinibacter sp. TaxID=2065818 RepID=UPI0021E849AE|nr:hypothetical protein [Salinibacter sp.]
MSTRDTASPVTAADASPWRRMLRRIGRAPGVAWGALAVVCIASRLATTITYIEDPDSLRFALSVADTYDIAALQPHFPGYPLFWAAAELFYLPTGSFSTSFSLVGGLATVGLVWALLRLWGRPLRSVDGAALAGAVALNPLLWLMANRYMPDLLGTAWAVATLAVLVRAWDDEGPSQRRAALGGMALAGLLAGLRLSYLPLVVIPALLVLGRSARPVRLIAAGAAGVGVWLVPMVLDTGLWTLIDVAWGQTTGHFTDFGGRWGRHVATVAERGPLRLPCLDNRGRRGPLRPLDVLLPERGAQEPARAPPLGTAAPGAGGGRGGPVAGPCVAHPRGNPGGRWGLRRGHARARGPAPQPVGHRPGQGVCRDHGPDGFRADARRVRSARQHVPPNPAGRGPVSLN